jgi:hypothetical protein
VSGRIGEIIQSLSPLKDARWLRLMAVARGKWRSDQGLLLLLLLLLSWGTVVLMIERRTGIFLPG